MSSTADPHLRAFQASITSKILKYGEHQTTETDFIHSQKTQVVTLSKLEEAYRKELIKSDEGKAVYVAFIEFIREDRKNILDARPYFRVRQAIFTKTVSPALRKKNPIPIYRCHFNYSFVKFSAEHLDLSKHPVLYDLFKQIGAVRNKLIEVNTPLAIAQASAFFKKTKRKQDHLTRMDGIQNAIEGLTQGVDKFCGKYDNIKYRHTIIGRVLGTLIMRFSETMVHYYPIDKRKLYNANKVMAKCRPEDFKQISEKINDIAKEHNYVTTPEEISHIMAASSSISSDIPVALGNDHNTKTIQDTLQYADIEDNRPDRNFEQVELSNKLAHAMKKLTILEQKVLKMKGLDF